MGFLSASKSFFSAIAGALTTTHSWQYNTARDQRTCTCCGRREEIVLDLVSTNWEVLVPGDLTAHAAKPITTDLQPSAAPDLVAARTPDPSI